MSETFSKRTDERAADRADNADALRHVKEFCVGDPPQEYIVVNVPIHLTPELFDDLTEYARTAALGPWGREILLREWAMAELMNRLGLSLEGKTELTELCESEVIDDD